MNWGMNHCIKNKKIKKKIKEIKNQRNKKLKR
jgi:hypothetical protein